MKEQKKYKMMRLRKTNVGSICIVSLNNLGVPSLSPMSHGRNMSHLMEMTQSPINLARVRFRPYVG